MITPFLGRGLISLRRRQFAAGQIAAPRCWPETRRFLNKSPGGQVRAGLGSQVDWGWLAALVFPAAGH